MHFNTIATSSGMNHRSYLGVTAYECFKSSNDIPGIARVSLQGCVMFS